MCGMHMQEYRLGEFCVLKIDGTIDRGQVSITVPCPVPSVSE